MSCEKCEYAANVEKAGIAAPPASPEAPAPPLAEVATPGAIATPARVRWLESNLPRIHIRDVGRGGHFIQEEVPEAISSELDAWLRELP